MPYLLELVVSPQYLEVDLFFLSVFSPLNRYGGFYYFILGWCGTKGGDMTMLKISLQYFITRASKESIHH